VLRGARQAVEPRRPKPQHLREPLRPGQRGQRPVLRLQTRHASGRGELPYRQRVSISGLAFYKGGPYPDEYDDALFFGDHSRRYIWVMKKGTNGLPNPGQLKPFVADAENPVDLEIGSGVSRCLLAPLQCVSFLSRTP
jgi:hypothetical protein